MSSWTSAALASALVVAGCDGDAPRRPQPSAPETATDTVAVLSRSVGDVRVRLAGHAHWGGAVEGRALGTSDAVQTMSDAAATLTFRHSRERAHLGPNSVLHVPAQVNDAVRLQHMSGGLTVSLTEASQAERLEVRLPMAELVMERPGLGRNSSSEVHVEVDDDEAEIVMRSGTSRLVRENEEDVDLEESVFVRLDGSAHIIERGVDTPGPSALRAPADGTTVVTQGSVRFAWEPVAEARGYLLEVDGAGRSRELEVNVPTGTIGLDPGRYEWCVRAITALGTSRRSDGGTFTVAWDRTAPAIALRQPPNNATTARPVIQVVGRTEPNASVRANGRVVRPDREGRFQANVPVTVGLTNVVVRARDAAGNESAVTRSILRVVR